MTRLSIRALGPLVVTLDGRAITGLAYDKVWALLVYLAQTNDHPHRRESLAELLWPDQPERKAHTNLRQALARLRKAIGAPNATPPFLWIERTEIQFNAASDATLDVGEFNVLLTACATHAHRHATGCAACAIRREQAVALYRGPFLDQFYVADSAPFEEWATLVREPLHQRALDALDSLVAYHERQGDYARALHFSERQLELDPWREEAYRQIMRLLALNGHRSAALQYYERCRAVLDSELGVTPSGETSDLYEQIRADAFGAAAKMEVLARPMQRRHTLPLPPTPFLGRTQELAALADLLVDPASRLITLLGPGGIGKTRLALQVGSNAAGGFADGSFFVNLAPLNTPEHLVPTVAAALDFTLANRTAPLTELLQYLRQKELLLILDNFEHLLESARGPTESDKDSAVALLTAILQRAPGVTLLVTSRTRLNLQGEWVFDVDGLATPDQTWQGSEDQGEELEAYSAAALFLQTARRVRQDFSPTTADRAALVRICRLVQGMPLALEVAAAWVRILSCREIADEIAQSLGFLTTTLRDLPERHRSLQAVFDHSWKLLSADEQHVFACCSVFRGGFTRAASAEVAGASLPLLAALVDKSLLRREQSGRYEVHELARQYAAEKLVDAHQVTQTRNRHLVFFMHFAEAAEWQILGGEQVAQWHEWVELEHDNLRAALEWSLNGGEFEPGLRIVGALWEFWMNRGHAPEAQTQAERFLARPTASARTLLRAKVMHTAGVCAFYHGRYSTALTWFAETAAIAGELGESGRYHLALALIGQGYTRLSLREFEAVEVLSQHALTLGEEMQNAWVKADALYQLGILTWVRGDLAGAHRQILDSLECFEAAGNSVMRGPVMMRLGTLLLRQGDYVAAQAYLRRSLAVCEELGDKLRASSTLVQLGHLIMTQGNFREANELLTKALRLTRETAHLLNRIAPLDALGRLAQRQGDHARARAMHQESLSLSIEMKHPVKLTHAVEAFACLAARQGQAEVAAHLFGACDKHLSASDMYLTSIQMPFDPMWQPEHDQLVASVRKRLGETEFAAAWAAGAAMTLDEAVTLIDTLPRT